MTYTYKIHPIAQKDYLDSVEWYLERSELATENFVTAVKRSIDSICKQPYLYKNYYRHYREANLYKFPFTIVYYIDEDNYCVNLVAIYHQSRNPKKKYHK